MKRLCVLSLATAALVLADVRSFRVTLFQPSLVNGAELRPGEYKVELTDGKAVIRNGREKVEAAVKTETADSKFSSTSVRYRNGDGKFRLHEIRIGGTNMRVIFND